MTLCTLSGSRSAQGSRRRRLMGARLLETLESRLLMSGVFGNGHLSGDVAFGSLSSAGTMHLDGSGGITSGMLLNEDGSTSNAIDPSSYLVQASGVTGLNVTVQTGESTGVSYFNGAMNSSHDVVALNQQLFENETVTGLTGLDVMVVHTGNFTQSDFTGTWNVAGQNYRATLKVNDAGQVSGLIYLENNTHTGTVTGGTATLNGDGTGTLTFTTNLTAADAAFQSLSLAVVMGNGKDVVMGNRAAIGDDAPGGTVPSELTVMVKSVGAYSAKDVMGTVWTVAAANGAGNVTFLAGGKLSGTVMLPNGVTGTMSGTYSVGGNGTLIANIVVKTGDTVVLKESLFGAVNKARNVIALDRAIGNADGGSSLTVLISSTNRAPTERATAVWGESAYRTSSITMDYATVLSAIEGRDLDGDALSLLITEVPEGSGTLTILHNEVTSAVIPGTTVMVEGDVLTWSPGLLANGQVTAFSVKASDGDVSAANATKVVVNAGALPVVSANATKAFALEAQVGKTSGNGVITLSRVGGDTTKPLTVTIHVGGPAVLGTMYNLVGPNGATISDHTATVTFLAGQKSAKLTVVPLNDGVVDATLGVEVTVLADPNTEVPGYLPSVKPSGRVALVDGNPTVTIRPAVVTVKEGDSNVTAFWVERLAAQGGGVTGPLTVNLGYSGTFDVEGHLSAPASVTFGPGEVKKLVKISTTGNGVANEAQSLVATISGEGFAVGGSGHESVLVLDSAPKVTIATVDGVALESDPVHNQGKMVITRSGPTTEAMTVYFTTGTGDGVAVQGTNYTLTDGTNTLANSVAIPAGAASVAVFVVPLDDHINNGTLKAVVTLAPVPEGPSVYRLVDGGKVGTVNIVNDKRLPLVAHATFPSSVMVGSALTWTFDVLVDLIGASKGEASEGALSLVIGKRFAGELRVLRNGSEVPEFAPVGTVLMPGDQLRWSPGGNTTGVVQAFTLMAKEGDAVSATGCLFTMTVAPNIG